MLEYDTDIWKKALIGAALDAVIVIDEHGFVLDFNQAAETCFGYLKQDILGKSMAELIVPPALQAGHTQGLERLRTTGIAKILGQRLELPAVRSDGSEFPVELIVVQVDTSPRPVYVGYVRDISERKRNEETLRASEERFRNLADTAPAMIWLSNEGNERTWFNRVWLQFVGQEMAAQVGHAWIKGVHPDDLERFLGLYEEAVEGREPYSMEYRLRHHDGSYRWILDHGTPVFDTANTYTGYAGSCIDITERREAEEALRLTQFSVDNAGDAVFWVGPNAELLYANNRACESLGFTPAELSNLSVLDFSPDFEKDEWQTHWEGLKQKGNDTFETIHQRKDKSTFPVEISVNYLEAAGREMNFAYARDITDRREQESRVAASEAKLRAISDAAIDAVVLIDPKGHIAHWNPAAREMFGYTTEEIANRTVHDILTPIFEGTDVRDWGDWTRADQGGQILEMTACRHDGHVFPVELSLSVAQLSNQCWAVAVIRDATERKRFETQLKKALEDAQAANHAKSEFLALVSHEMRTPLNSILGMIELALDTVLSGDQQEMLSTSRQSGHQLKRLISDMLDYSQIEMGRFDLRAGIFDLLDSLGRIREEFSQRAQSKGLEFRWQVARDVPASLIGDSRRLEQVLENLLDNAVKFTEQGFISFASSASMQPDGRVRVHFRVTDTGIGVEKEHRERIFNRFEQVDSSSTRNFGGIGLGLSICQQLVDRMGGELVYEEASGGGSVFAFSVVMQPTQREPSQPAGPKTDDFADVAGLSVLLAEDDPPSRAVATRMLERAGVQVIQAIDGRDAVEKFQNASHPLDAIFMDMMMPRLDGMQAAEQIRKLQPNLPIIAMTAQAMKGDRERFLSAGLSAYIAKPIDRGVVLEALRNVASTARTRQKPPVSPAKTASFEAGLFDPEALRKRCDHDDSLVTEVIQLFHQTCSETIAKIDRELIAENREELEQAAHRLKGAVGNMCAPAALKSAQRLEEAARLGDMARVHRDYARLRVDVQQLRQDLDHLMG